MRLLPVLVVLIVWLGAYVHATGTFRLISFAIPCPTPCVPSAGRRPHAFDLNRLPSEATPPPLNRRTKATFLERQARLRQLLRERIPELEEHVDQVRRQAVDDGIPRQSLVPDFSPDLIAAHYLFYFDPEWNHPRLPYLSPDDIDYRSSVVCFLICFYDHCGADRGAYAERHGRRNLLKFRHYCRGRECCDAVKRLRREQQRHPPADADAGPSDLSLQPFQPPVQLDGMLDLQRLGLAPARPTAVVRPLPPYAYRRMDLVAAWYAAHRAPGVLAPATPAWDRRFLDVHAWLLFCYYGHCAGSADAFRARLLYGEGAASSSGTATRCEFCRTTSEAALFADAVRDLRQMIAWQFRQAEAEGRARS